MDVYTCPCCLATVPADAYVPVGTRGFNLCVDCVYDGHAFPTARVAAEFARVVAREAGVTVTVRGNTVRFPRP